MYKKRSTLLRQIKIMSAVFAVGITMLILSPEACAQTPEAETENPVPSLR